MSERGRDGWMDGWMDEASKRASEGAGGWGRGGWTLRQGVHSVPAHRRLSPARGAAPARAGCPLRGTSRPVCYSFCALARSGVLARQASARTHTGPVQGREDHRRRHLVRVDEGKRLHAQEFNLFGLVFCS